MESSPKECGICHDEYDEERRLPRMFKCSHTLCSACLNRLIEMKSKDCPFCRQRFTASTVADVPVNLIVTEFIRYVSLIEGSSRDLRSNTIGELKVKARQVGCTHLDKCEKAQKRIETAMSEITLLRNELQFQNDLIENEVKPRIQRITSQNSEHIKDLEKLSQSLNTQLEAIKTKCKKLEEINEAIDTCVDETFEGVAAVLDQANEMHTAVEKWIGNFQSAMADRTRELDAQVKEKQDRKITVAVLLDVLSSCEELSAAAPALNTAAIVDRNYPLHITIENLCEMSSQIRYLLARGGVFAVQQHEGKIRSALIFLTKDGKLCLHSLRDESPPSGALVIQFQELIDIVDFPISLAFLELSNEDSTLGRLYIKLTPNTLRGKQFCFLCSGQLGPSYVGTQISSVSAAGDLDEFVTFGCFKDGNENEELVPGAGEETGGPLEMKWLAGTLDGIEDDLSGTMFDIMSNTRSNVSLSSAFGIVQEGLAVLEEAIVDHPVISKVFISDAGIVITL